MLILVCKYQGIEPLFVPREEFGTKRFDGRRRCKIALFCEDLLVRSRRSKEGDEY